MKYTDPDGESATLAGLLIGGVAGGVSALTQGKEFGSNDFWAGVAGGAASGAIAGAALDLTVATGGVGAIAIVATGGFLGGATGSLIESKISGEEISLANVLGDALIGGVANLCGYGVSKVLANRFSNSLSKALKTEGSELYKAVHSSVLSKESGTLQMSKIMNDSKLAGVLADQGVGAALTYLTDMLQDKINLGE